MPHFTDGPWSGCKGGECQCGYIFGFGGQVYVAQALGPGNTDEHGCPDPHPRRDMQKANAKLIISAPALASAAAMLCQRLINKGYGQTSDKALPGEFDTLCHLVQECGYELRSPKGIAGQITATEAGKTTETTS